MNWHSTADLRREEIVRRMSAGLLSGGSAAIAMARRPEGCIPPMTDEQRHIWLDSARMPDAPLYNEPITIHYRGPYDHDVFLRSFDEVLRRHESLRLSFGSLDDDPVQVMHDDVHADFPLLDLTGIAPNLREGEALAVARADAMRPFDLEAAPLFRGRVIRHGERDHRLYLVLHHILFDGVSIYRVLVPELAVIHAAYAEGRDHGLPEPGIRYGDYAVWQRNQTGADILPSRIAYWVERMKDYPAIALPVDRQWPARPSGAGSMKTFALDRELVERLRALGKAEGATLYMTLLAALKALLLRYSGQDDIVVGGVTDTRRRPEIQAMIGYCLNVIPLRTKVSATMSFRQLQSEVRDTVLGALENSDVPYERIVREVRKADHARQRALFNVFFSIEPPAPSFGDHWDLTQMEIPPRTAKYDLYFEVDERPDGMAARILYSTELFDEDSIARMIGHWIAILRHAAADPDTALGALRMMDDREEAAIDAGGRGRDVDIPDITVPEMVGAAAAIAPDRPALVHRHQVIAYGELTRRVGTLAAAIRAKGVRPGDVVALCCERSPDMIMGALAIMEAGGVYLPLDHAFPKARLAAIVADARPTLVVAQSHLADELPDWGIALLRCDDVTLAGDELPAHRHRPSDLAYLMYTSGSTGTPKGVEIEHRALVNLLCSMRHEPGFTADDVMLAVTTPIFDISILEMLLPLISGGRVVIADRDDVVDPARIMRLIDTSGCTTMQATPTMWRSLLSSGWTGKPGLRVMCGGEALPADIATAILKRGMRLWNMYGPTETTIWSSVHEIAEGQPITIGRPIDNTRFVVLDDQGAPQPVNVPGMLHIGGAGLARGYRDDRLTAARFARCQRTTDERLYRTGDLALMRHGGVFEWLGRTDGQIKVRGHRIDAGDVEAALATHPAVRVAAVRSFVEVDGDTKLAACVVPTPGETLDVATINQHLRNILPLYMIPARYVPVDALPLTANGKIDRNALPIPGDDTGPVSPRTDDPPLGPWEQGLAAIWSDLLGIQDVARDDDFYDLGGHSLLAARMMSRISSRFGRRLPLSTLMQASTVRTLASVIAGETQTLPTDRVIVIGADASGPTLYWIDATPNLRPEQFRHMASALGEDIRLVGLTIDLQRHDDLRATRTLADLAADLAETIRRASPSRPCLLGGWCNGGVLAYEVAQQLDRSGHPVGLLVLLDSANPVVYRSRWTRLLLQVEQMRTLPARERMPFLRAILAGYYGRFYGRITRPSTEEADLEALNQRFMQLVNAYAPDRYGGRMMLLQPRDGKIDYAPGWRRMGADPCVKDIAGGHITMLSRPWVDDLARTIIDAVPDSRGAI